MALEELGSVAMSLIEQRVAEGSTHKRISQELQVYFPNLKGCSSRSVRRYCKNKDIHRTQRLNTSSLDTLLLWSIGKVRLNGQQSSTIFEGQGLSNFL